MANAKSVEALLALAGKFVVAQKGDWDHEAWEALLTEVEGMGLELTDECKRNLGNVLEASKYFYHRPAAKKGVKAEAKPKKKAKAGAKKKAKS